MAEPTTSYAIDRGKQSYSIVLWPLTRVETRPKFFACDIVEHLRKIYTTAQHHERWDTISEPSIIPISISRELAFVDWKLSLVGRLNPPTEEVAVRSLRERELNWLRQNLQEIYKFSGQWIAIEGEKIVFYAPDLPTVVKKARDAGIETPFIIKVPAKDEGPLIV